VEIIYLLIPLSLVLVGVIVWAFFWAVRWTTMTSIATDRPTRNTGKGRKQVSTSSKK
jgi:hypothetical protein